MSILIIEFVSFILKYFSNRILTRGNFGDFNLSPPRPVKNAPRPVSVTADGKKVVCRWQMLVVAVLLISEVRLLPKELVVFESTRKIRIVTFIMAF
jgi:hypothetical protein